MFSKNDKYALMADRAINIITILMGVVGIVLSLFLIISGFSSKNYLNLVYGLVALGAAAIECVVFWVFAHLIVSYFVDIKLIRNRMYDTSNKDLSPVVGDDCDKSENDNK